MLKCCSNMTVISMENGESIHGGSRKLIGIVLYILIIWLAEHIHTGIMGWTSISDILTVYGA
jgi:hypothetical protein